MTATTISPAAKAWATRRAAKAALTAPVAVQVQGFCEPGSIALLADADLLALFSTVGAAVSKRFLIGRPALSSWNTVLDYLKSAMAFRATEELRVLFLDKNNNLIADEVMGTGTVDHVPVYPREVARRALELNASALILVHNHPSGNTTPSSADVQMTKALVEAVKVFGISIHDHIIIARGDHASMKALRLF
ncbi:JAB domain-containing protein [Bradyrhizobium sp. LjRoot220]|uniref:JAB domain-containing protein n=1 Tax=Bradyrhizobium sp. LjRoot220 TaxID=3342284 RepID=UPI003F500696